MEISELNLIINLKLRELCLQIQKRGITDKSITRIKGELMKPDVEQLIKDLTEIAIKFKTGAFTGREENTHMCFRVLQLKYMGIIIHGMWT